MAKVAVVTDSNSGITQEQAKEMGISVVPMPFSVDGKICLEGIDLTQEEFYEKMAAGADISTSQPSPDQVTGLWDGLLKDYDQIVHIPMSSGLSGSCQTAIMLSEDYEGKVQVVNNQRISVTQRRSVEDAIRLAKEGADAVEIKDFLEKDKFQSSIYIMLDTLYYLKKGGRITPAAAALGTVLRLKPVLQIQGEKLDAFAKARTVANGKQIMINAVRADIRDRFGGTPEHPGMWIDFAYTNVSRDGINQFSREALSFFPNAGTNTDPLSLSIATHIGPNAIAVALSHRNDGK